MRIFVPVLILGLGLLASVVRGEVFFQSGRAVISEPAPSAAIARGVRSEPEEHGLRLSGNIAAAVYSPNAWMAFRASTMTAEGKILSAKSLSASDQRDVVRVFFCSDRLRYAVTHAVFFSRQPRSNVTLVAAEDIPTGVSFQGCRGEIGDTVAFHASTVSASKVRSLLQTAASGIGLRVRYVRSRELAGNLGNYDEKEWLLKAKDLQRMW